MFHKISEQIVAYAIKTDALDQEKETEYIYGLELSLSVLTSYLSVIIIGIIMGMIWQSALFLLLFVSVRRFAGGFHFSSQIICYLVTCIMSTLVLLIIKYTGNDVFICSVIMGLSTLTLLILSPVPAIEKPLDDKEKIIYGRISRIMLIIVLGIYVALCFFQKMYTAKIISITIFAIAIFAILGKIKYGLYRCERAAL